MNRRLRDVGLLGRVPLSSVCVLLPILIFYFHWPVWDMAFSLQLCLEGQCPGVASLLLTLYLASWAAWVFSKCLPCILPLVHVTWLSSTEICKFSVSCCPGVGLSVSPWCMWTCQGNRQGPQRDSTASSSPSDLWPIRTSMPPPNICWLTDWRNGQAEKWLNRFDLSCSPQFLPTATVSLTQHWGWSVMSLASETMFTPNWFKETQLHTLVSWQAFFSLFNISTKEGVGWASRYCGKVPSHTLVLSPQCITLSLRDWAKPIMFRVTNFVTCYSNFQFIKSNY